jgi:hypothetical protein
VQFSTVIDSPLLVRTQYYGVKYYYDQGGVVGTRGPTSKGYTAEIRVPVSADIDDALNQLVAVSGIAKAHFVRVAVLNLLTEVGVLYPELAATLKPTATAGGLMKGLGTNA